MDFQPPASKHVARSQSIFSFIAQFRHLDEKWENCYHEETSRIITHCVDYQDDLLFAASPSPADLSSETCLIALALRALLFSHEIFEVDCRVPQNVFNVPNMSYYKAEVYYPTDPQLEIWHLPNSSALDSRVARPEDVDLYGLLRDIVHKMQQLLMRPTPRPNEWPALLYAICVMQLVTTNIKPNLTGLKSISRTEASLSTLLECICSLYELVTQGCHPLSDTWDLDRYKMLVGHDSVAVRAFSRLREHWLSGELFLIFCVGTLYRVVLTSSVGACIMDAGDKENTPRNRSLSNRIDNYVHADTYMYFVND